MGSDSLSAKEGQENQQDTEYVKKCNLYSPILYSFRFTPEESNKVIETFKKKVSLNFQYIPRMKDDVFFNKKYEKDFDKIFESQILKNLKCNQIRKFEQYFFNKVKDSRDYIVNLQNKLPSTIENDKTIIIIRNFLKRRKRIEDAMKDIGELLNYFIYKGEETLDYLQECKKITYKTKQRE